LRIRGYSLFMARRSKGGKRASPAGRDQTANQVRRRRPDDADAFIREPDSGPVKSNDDLADELARDFVSAATSGEDVADENFEQEVPEEVGGPFVESDGGREFDLGPDESNPPDSTKEALPTAMGSGPATQGDLEEAEEGTTSDETEDETEDEIEESEPRPEQPRPAKK
jgi:hypothetical protein